MNVWETNGGIYLGYEVDRTQGPPTLGHILRYKGDRHMCTIAPNGAGKSRRLLLVALAELLGWSIVVTDIKGELGAMTMEHRRAAGSQIIRLNPFNVLDLGSDGFNPIGALELGKNFPDDALFIAESVIRIEGREPHWAQAAQELVAALIMYVRLVIPNGSFGDVRKLLGQDDTGIRTMVLSPGADIKNDKGKIEEHYFRYKGMKLPGMIEAGERFGWEQIGTKASRFGDINPENRELHSVISTALTQTRWIDSMFITEDLARNPFDFGVIKDRPVTVYLQMPADRLATHSTWLRLVIASILQPLMRDTRRRKVPVLLMLDEYAALASGSGFGAHDTGDGFPAIAGRMAMFRGFGIKLWTVWQDLAQAKRIYGDGFESFLGNAGVVQTMSPQDITTSEHFSRLTGQTTREVVTGSQSRNPNPGAPMGVSVTEGVNKSLIPAPLMLPQDIRAMDIGYSILFSHLAKGTVRTYLPDPSQLSHLRAICALDPGL